jgi:hypothetical protein
VVAPVAPVAPVAMAAVTVAVPAMLGLPHTAHPVPNRLKQK